MATKQAAAKTAPKKAAAPVKAAEKTPVAKAAIKAEAKPVKPLKIGTKVSYVRRNGEKQEGVVSGLPEIKGNGTSAFVPVNIGTKKEPDIARRRQSELTVI